MYLHIPFCKQACCYCNFHFSTSLKRKEEMLNAMVKELILRKNEISEPVETIYFGGGTPSLLTIDELQLLIDTVYQNYPIIDNPEITLEANPDDLSQLSFRTSQTEGLTQVRNLYDAYRQLGINRLSIGIQSFFEEDLQFMNRAHTAHEALNCLKEATQYFDNITVDLIYGIPNLSTEKWRENLQMVFDLGINHLSSYALTVEPKTALANFINSGKYPPIDEALALEHFNILVEESKKQGFIQYEISNFGKENYFSKHNTAYWQGKPYLGIGPSAHSFNGKTRSWNVSNNALYLKSIAQNELPSESETLSKEELFNETIMTGLRTIWGVDLNKIESDFGIIYKTQLLKQAEKHIRQGTLEIILDKKTSILKITQKGLFLSDGIAADLFVL
ncbi:MAG: radical SAM family heme chaperone HemW [Flavobacteriales bacterium]|nr:radical SAM family heme chaperone HemW [Flavobacteriales bacterium]